MIPRHECVGCRDDFYNGPDRRCWSGETGRMMVRYAIHFMTAPTQKGAFTKVRKPSCYHQVNQLVFYNELPNFVKASDLNRARRRPSQPNSPDGGSK